MAADDPAAVRSEPLLSTGDQAEPRAGRTNPTTSAHRARPGHATLSQPLRVVRYHPRAASGDGGMSNAIRGWSPAMVEAGAEVTVAFEDGTPPRNSGGVRWARVEHRGPHALRVPVGLGSILEQTDLLVLHGAWTSYNLRAGALARAAGVPYLLEPRGAYDPAIFRRRRIAKRIWWWAGERNLVAGAAAMHAFFSAQVDHVRGVGYEGPVIVAPNGIDAPVPGSWKREPSGFILWLGRFDPQHKGLDLLVRGVAGLPPTDRPLLQLRGPDFRGGKAVIENLVHELGVESWVTVGPAVYGAAKRGLLLQADAFVYPSRWEGCGNSVLEAISYGLPTLCTTYPLGEFLAERGAAFLARPTPEALGAALMALRDRARADEVGRIAAQVARDHFSWLHVARSWLAQASGVLAGGQRAPLRDEAG